MREKTRQLFYFLFCFPVNLDIRLSQLTSENLSKIQELINEKQVKVFPETTKVGIEETGREDFGSSHGLYLNMTVREFTMILLKTGHSDIVEAVRPFLYQSTEV